MTRKYMIVSSKDMKFVVFIYRFEQIRAGSCCHSSYVDYLSYYFFCALL